MQEQNLQEKSLLRFNKQIKNNEFLRNVLIENDNKKIKGSVELRFLTFINNNINSFKRYNNNYVLPSYSLLAQTLNCSRSFVCFLVKKHQDLFGFTKLTKEETKQKYNFAWKFKNNFWVPIKEKVDFVFQKMKLFIFKTKQLKDYFKNIAMKKTQELKQKYFNSLNVNNNYNFNNYNTNKNYYNNNYHYNSYYGNNTNTSFDNSNYHNNSEYDNYQYQNQNNNYLSYNANYNVNTNNNKVDSFDPKIDYFNGRLVEAMVLYCKSKSIDVPFEYKTYKSKSSIFGLDYEVMLSFGKDDAEDIRIENAYKQTAFNLIQKMKKERWNDFDEF